MKRIYLDYAASTPVDPKVLEVMLPEFKNNFGNSSSAHFFGRKAKETIEKGRQTIAKSINANPEEIIFTSSATESNNTALKGVVWANKNKGNHIITTTIEHDCILNSANWLEGRGLKITRLAVDKYGLINLQDLKKAITKKTILVSVMHANNEIGTIQPIAEIGKICRQKGILFHTDAAQSFGKAPLDVLKMNIDLLTASAHKIYGPKGVALLYVKKGVKIEPLLHGGGHEKGLRSSTMNPPLIAGFAKAASIAQKQMKKETARLIKLRENLIKGILKTIPQTFLNGHPQKRLRNNANIRFSHIEGEAIMLKLDQLGVAVSTGSACSSQSLKPSHVLLATGLKPEQIHGSIRFSLGRWTKKEEIDYVLKVLPKIIKDLRQISPFKG
jgi:cysteine desulfurase